MVAGLPKLTTIVVSGILGSNPVCKKISFQIPASGTTEQVYDVSNNSPNGSYSEVAVDMETTPTYLKVRLYDDSNNIIAQTGNVAISYEGIVP